jgi:hypothetical protein
MNHAVMFTALPNGVSSADSTGTVVSLSIYVSPQLGAGTLADVAGFVHWPATAAALTFGVQFNSTASNAPRAAAWLDPDPRLATGRFDVALWNKLFSPTMPLNAWSVRDHSTSGVLSYGAKAISDGVKSTYRAIAPLHARPILGASTDLLTQRVKDIAGVLPSAKAIGAGVAAGVGGTAPSLSRKAMTSLALQPRFAETPEFARAAAFYNRGDWRKLTGAPSKSPFARSGAVPAIPPGPPPVDHDFHTTVGHLADHPALLRRLGLVIDVLFKLPALGTDGKTLDGVTSLFLTVGGSIAGLDPAAKGGPIRTPWTHTVVHSLASGKTPEFRPFYGDVETDPSFGNTPLTNPLLDKNGMLRLDDASVLHIDDLDIDHAATHVADFAEKASKDLNALPASASPALSVSVPALRTAGFALHHGDREQQIGLRFTRTYALENSPSAVMLVAEDLVRGYKVDVRPEGGKWTSLCMRQTQLAVDGDTAAPLTLHDEGYIKATAMSAASNEPLFNLSESMFHWDGWSLVARRPGLSVGPTPGSATPGDGPVLTANSGAALGLPFSLTIAPEAGSLPRLRFGTRYQFRVRAVNLAGGDMVKAATAADQAVDHASPLAKFSRYEPVSPPVLVMRRAVTEGESVERLVIRSDPYGPTVVHADAWAKKNNVAAPGTVTPPGAQPSMGMGQYFATCERHVAPPKTSVHLTEYHGAFDRALAGVAPALRVNRAWAIASKEDGSFFDTHATDTTTGQYQTVSQAGRLIVTPPASRAEAVFKGTDAIVPRGSTLAPGQYVVVDSDSVTLPYLPDPSASGVAVQGLGADARIRSFGPRAAGGAWPELSTFRLVRSESPGALTVAGFDDSAPAPSATLQVALPAASVLTLGYSSALADPTLHAFGPASPSDVSYPDAVRGKLAMLSPTRTLTLVHAVQRPAAPSLEDADVSPADRSEGETAHTLGAVLRFDGASSSHVSLVASWNEILDVPSDPPVDPSAHPVAHSGAIVSLTVKPEDAMYQSAEIRQLFGDTKRRDIDYQTVATTRFREYFPSSITSDAANITNRSATVRKTVRSSARPPAPRVLYAVPSFRFISPSSGATARTRLGGGVRVYVDRGWFATGTDERLAVILARSDAEMRAMPSLVSVWGPDPIWYRGTLGPLNTAHVAASAGVFSNVKLAEGAGTVHVATYTPSFNADRKLWYFDIELATDQAYFPFLRLALARFQPESIGELHMSRVVTSEFVQLAADRTASVALAGSGTFSVSLLGPTAANLTSPSASPVAMASGHTVTAEIQEATTASPDALDWVTIGDVTVLPPAVVSGTSVGYQGELTYPDWNATAGAKHRVLFKEYEIYATDNQVGVRQGTGLVHIGDTVSGPYAQRLVYADAVAISV